MIGSSMRMAYRITKMNAFSTNITFSHISTSLDKLSHIDSQHDYSIRKSHKMQAKKRIFYFHIPFLWKRSYNVRDSAELGG